jgi:hypothetical protein
LESSIENRIFTTWIAQLAEVQVKLFDHLPLKLLESKTKPKKNRKKEVRNDRYAVLELTAVPRRVEYTQVSAQISSYTYLLINYVCLFVVICCLPCIFQDPAEQRMISNRLVELLHYLIITINKYL